MNKRELAVLSILVFILIVINVVGYMRKEKLKKNTEVIVQELTIQISINDATAGDLETLPGIGPSLAQRIVDYRENIGKFATLESLKEVKGIGEKLYSKIRPFIKL
jgi:comEA protein